MQSGNRVALSLNIGNIDAHSVVMHSIVKETITKVNGNIFENILYRVMDPWNGSIYSIPGYDITGAWNVFYIGR